jgi:hypothetical protein
MRAAWYERQGRRGKGWWSARCPTLALGLATFAFGLPSGAAWQLPAIPRSTRRSGQAAVSATLSRSDFPGAIGGSLSTARLLWALINHLLT